MHLLLCAATKFEVAPVEDFLAKEKITEVEVLVTGVGVMATAYALARYISARRPAFILQAGVAGCLNNALPLTSVVMVENETIGDLGVEESGRFRSVFEMGLADADVIPWKHRKLSNNLDPLRSAGLSIVDAVTVNEISTSPERISYYRNVLGASVESMEGAALHYVALQEEIPFLQIRSLSNFAGERDKKNWVMDLAIARLNSELQRIIIKILNK